MRCSLVMLDGDVGSELVKYAFHFFDGSGRTVFRYDNSFNHPGLPNFPHHKHIGSEESVVAAAPPDVEAILAEIRTHVAQG